MEPAIRNKLRNTVTQCRKLLEESIAQTFQGHFGIYRGNKDEVHVEDASRMTHLSAEDQAYRGDILDALEHIKALGCKPKEALDQLIREIAFTHLNRLCAYKMMETRQAWIGGQRFREAVSRGQKSQGFMFYLADHPEDEQLFRTGQQEVAYRHFLDWLGTTLSREIGVLFSPNDPANRLYPPQRVLDAVLALINSEELVGIWTEDETIGWVYQYFTPKALRDRARKERQPPQNTYELAFRNQFFTPRYVVKFLTDNTLGRIWYEMRKGDTKLTNQCRYMVRRPNEVFLEESQSTPDEFEDSGGDLSQDELLKQTVYIPHRSKKDPRDLKILDPACGSGHFLLYCFDLLQTIYEEAYDDPDLGPALKKDYPKLDDLRQAVPGLILSRNVHGIDIDLRATQIGALALWLRCQRAYQEMGLKSDRPKISRSNFVCAEPMPGEKQLLEDFLKTLRADRLEELIRRVMQVPEDTRVRATQAMAESLSALVRLMWEKMQLAGEAGSLLKIEEELQEAVRVGQEAWEEKLPLFRLTEFSLTERPKESHIRFLPGEGVSFWQRAESLVMAALHDFAAYAGNGERLLRGLYVDDAIQGFAFVDLCRQKFDVVLMNPPFGEPTRRTKGICEKAYPDQPSDLYCWFVRRASTLLQPNGFIGCITSSSFRTYLGYEEYRATYIATPKLLCLADLGWEVLDEAYVEASCYCIGIASRPSRVVPFFDLRIDTEKENSLFSMVNGSCLARVYWRMPTDFRILDSSPVIYEWPKAILRSLSQFQTLSSLCQEIGIGAGPHAFFYRLRWEVPQRSLGLSKKWAPLANGGAFSPFRREDWLVLEWEDTGRLVKEYILMKYPYLKGNTGWKFQLEQYYGKPGITYGKKTTNFSAQILPEGFIFSFEGIGVFPSNSHDIYWLLAYLNSSFCSWFLNATCGLHKNPPYLKRLPTPIFSSHDKSILEQIARDGWKAQFVEALQHEVSSYFLCPTAVSEALGDTRLSKYSVSDSRSVHDYLKQIDETVWKYINIPPVPREILLSNTDDQLSNDDEEPEEEGTVEWHSSTKALLSYAAGCIFGRWDIRFATGERQPPELPDPFATPPICPPGMLQGPDGFPLQKTPDGYPLSIDWDGVLVDAPDHKDDIIRCIREVLELICRDQVDTIEREACKILGVKELRDYFRRPGKGGFWDDHVSLYSKSRRKAPIYWLLQSSKKNYALWIYYHRLDKDILFKALLNCVEPKIRQEEDRLEPLRAQRTAASTSGKGVKKLEKEIDRQDEFLSELRDFEDKLRRVANLHLEPDLNDGVVLNIAPLWELVPWKEAKKYWEELCDGKYEWSSIGKQLRQKGIARNP